MSAPGQYTSVPVHTRRQSGYSSMSPNLPPPSPTTPIAPTAPLVPPGPYSPQHERQYSDSLDLDLDRDPPPRSTFNVSGMVPPQMGAARDSIASSLGQYGYPSHPAYRNSDYAGSTRVLNPSGLAYPAPGPGYRDDPGDRTPYYDEGSKPGTPMIPLGANRSDLDGDTLSGAQYGEGYAPARGYPAGGMSEKTYPEVRKKRGWLWFWGILIILCIIALAVIIPVYFLLIKPHQNSSSGSTASDSGTGGTSGNNGSTGGNGNGGGNGATPAPAFTGAITGGDGSTVTRDDGSTFVYTNAFGGTWYFDPSNPFVGGAQANEWTPRLNETWRWGVDQIRGVNLGGWLVTEPFIVPALYEPYQTGDFAPPYNAVDEWTLTVAMNKTGNATAMLDAHYSTFITEDDFAAIAAAGLNWVRIPIPYWAIEVYPGEPFVPHLAWQYFLKAIQWARKYGLRINMDLHTIPGSQNGWNHSGKLGPVNFLFGVMGIANAQRALAYIRTLAEFVSQPEYSQVVQYFGVVNEALVDTIGQPQMQTFYLEAYTMIRNITGLGQGNGPFIGIHDGFIGMQQWASFLQGSDRIAMDTHPYNAFNDASNAPLSSYIPSPCTGWGPALNQSMDQFGFSHAGEWSAAVNDCGKWVNGVGLGTRYEGTYPGTTTVIGSCDQWTEYGSWSPTTIQQTKEVVMASMDALQHWFFWTWKIGNSSVTGNIESPSWSYSLGLQHGWIPLDPRDAVDFCALSADVSMPSPTAGLQSWQTGGVGAGTIAADQLASFSHWPIISMNSAAGLSYLPPASVALLPQYVPTGGVITLPGPTFTTPSSTQTADAGNGWANADDTAGYYVPIVGCAYPNPWDAESATIPPTAQCQPTGVTRRGLEMDVGERAVPTPPPMIRSA